MQVHGADGGQVAQLDLEEAVPGLREDQAANALLQRPSSLPQVEEGHR